MAKGKRKHSKKPRVKPESDPEDPDVDSDSYYHDEVDKFHMEREKVLLDTGAQIGTNDVSSGEEEVLAFDDDDSDEDDDEFEEMQHRLKQMKRHHRDEDDEMASDLEDDRPKDKSADKSEKAWGSARSKFYGGHDSDIDEDLSGSEPEAAALEEQEALAIQKRLLQSLDDDDVGLDMLKTTPTIEEDTKAAEKITKDLSKLSQREKLKLLKKQSPELLDLIADMKNRCSELQDTLMPIHGLIRANKLPRKSSGAKFVETKTRLYLNYLVNVSFYLMLKAKQIPVENHPVIRRLVQYRNLMKQIDGVESRIRPEMLNIVQRLKDGEEFPVLTEEEETKQAFKSVLLNKKSKKSVRKTSEQRKRLAELVSDSDGEAEDELEEPSVGGRSKGRKKNRLDDLEEDGQMENDLGAELGGEDGDGDEDLMEDAADEDDEELQRRGINYQIEKNKGLTVKKRKELRNPRVKHRMKYRKAKIRRRGQVREVRTEMDRYGGEASGIRSGIIRSVKFR